MGFIHRLTTPGERIRLSQQDQATLRKALAEHNAVAQFLERRVNKQLLEELQCILDSKPLPKGTRHTAHLNSRVLVRDAKGRPVRIEYSNGHLYKDLSNLDPKDVSAVLQEEHMEFALPS